MTQLVIRSTGSRVWMLTGLMVIWFAVFASATSPRSETSPPSQSEKIKALRARIVELTQKLEESRESYQMTRDNLEGIQATCAKNARELRDIKSAIKNTLFLFDEIMLHEALPMYIAKRWGSLDFRTFEALLKRICLENPHLPCDVDSVYIMEREFNAVVHNLVFDGNGEVRAQVVDEAVEKQLQNIEEQWGSEIRGLVFEAFKELEEYARAHPGLNFRVIDNFWTPYNTGTNQAASYEDATKYVAAVVKVVVGLAHDCDCTVYDHEDDDMMFSDDEESMPPLEDDDAMDGDDDYEDLNWESTRVLDDRDPELVYHHHYGYG